MQWREHEIIASLLFLHKMHVPMSAETNFGLDYRGPDDLEHSDVTGGRGTVRHLPGWPSNRTGLVRIEEGGRDEGKRRKRRGKRRKRRWKRRKRRWK